MMDVKSERLTSRIYDSFSRLGQWEKRVSTEACRSPSRAEESTLKRGIIHRDDIGRRNVAENVMNLLKNKTSARTPNIYQALYVLPHLCRGAINEDFPRVAAPSPKAQTRAEITL